jgi:hypothetical protein
MITASQNILGAWTELFSLSLKLYTYAGRQRVVYPYLNEFECFD